MHGKAADKVDKVNTGPLRFGGDRGAGNEHHTSWVDGGFRVKGGPIALEDSEERPLKESTRDFHYASVMW